MEHLNLLPILLSANIWPRNSESEKAKTNSIKNHFYKWLNNDIILENMGSQNKKYSLKVASSNLCYQKRFANGTLFTKLLYHFLTNNLKNKK